MKTIILFAASGMLFTVSAASEGMANTKTLQRGEALFNSAFVPAPYAVRVREGLGPVYNAAACHNCHQDAGKRTRLDTTKQVPATMVLQLSIEQQNGHRQAHPIYGEILNPLSIEGVPPEARIQIKWVVQQGSYADGSTWQIKQPVLDITQLGYGPLGTETATSLRVPQALFGMGLLEQVAEDELLNPDHAAVFDVNINGRANIITNGKHQEIGRFGWKANHGSLRSQIAAALANEQGVTSTVHPESICTTAQIECFNADQGEQPEISDADLAAVIAFVRAFPVPEQMPTLSTQEQQGQALFHSIGCAQCHRSQLALEHGNARSFIAPYTDLLLHDMGIGLADNRSQHGANGREWRTPPLWGIGLAERMGQKTCYLHDCRANTLEEAILWHSGESQQVTQRYLALSKSQRHALIGFVRTL